MCNKPKYNAILYFKEKNKYIIEKLELNEKPNINDYQNYFAPKLSKCFSIQFMEYNEGVRAYKMLESWFKNKRGWVRII